MARGEQPGNDDGATDIDNLVANCPELAEARDYGIDIPMLLDNLKRPISERIRCHNIALETMIMLGSSRS